MEPGSCVRRQFPIYHFTLGLGWVPSDTHTHIHACTYTHTCTHACMHTRTHAHAHAHTQISLPHVKGVVRELLVVECKLFYSLIETT